MKNQRILVTGGTGVLGSYIVEALLEDGFAEIEIFSRGGRKESLSFSDNPKVTFTKGDIAELHPLTEAIERSSYIIHASAVVSFHPKRFKDMHAINVDGTTNIANISLDSNVKKLIHISSISALGRDEKGGVISENTPWTNSKYNSYYGITKYLAEKEIWRAHHEGLNMAIVNPSVVLGAGQWGQSSLQLFKRVYDGIPYYPIGGTAIVDARDVAQIVLHLLKSTINGQRYIASAGNISYKDLFQKMATSMKRPMVKKPAPHWMLALLWRIEKFRTHFTGSEPLVTRETVRSTSHISEYDNKKSKSLPWGEFRSIDETIKEFSISYKNYRS